MQHDYGMAGVRFFMSWLALIVAALIARPHWIGLSIVGALSLVWAACCVRFVIHRVKAGSTLDDIDLMLCVVALGLTATVPLIVAPFWLHMRRPGMMVMFVGWLIAGLASAIVRRSRI